MTDFKEWIESLKTNPELGDSVRKMEKYFTSEGFNTQEFDGILNKALKSIEQSIRKKLNQSTNAND